MMCDNIKKLISNSKTKEAINELLKINNNEAILLSERYRSLELDLRKGLISPTDYRVEIGRINNAILSICGEKIEPTENKINHKIDKRFTNAFFVISFLVIVGSLIYYFYPPDDVNCKCPIERIEITNEINDLVRIIEKDSFGLKGTMNVEPSIKWINGELVINGKKQTEYFNETESKRISNFDKYQKETFLHVLIRSKCCFKYIRYCQKEGQASAKLDEVVEEYYEELSNIQAMVKGFNKKEKPTPIIKNQQQIKPPSPEKEESSKLYKIEVSADDINLIKDIYSNDKDIEIDIQRDNEKNIISFKVPLNAKVIVKYNGGIEREFTFKDSTQTFFKYKNLNKR